MGELALAGVGIIPAMEPSRGYTDMVPFRPFLQPDSSEGGRFDVTLFALFLFLLEDAYNDRAARVQVL